jgi:very-short-patch-repair endonuclease
MWKALRVAPGFHFRRQVAVGDLVYDFGDHGSRLLIEVDGGVHDAPNVASRDSEKDAAAEALGYRVVRLANALVLKEPDLALAYVLRIARADLPPTPTPPHKGEGKAAEAP